MKRNSIEAYNTWLESLKATENIDFKAHGIYKDQGIQLENILNQDNKIVEITKEFSFDIFTFDQEYSIRFKKKTSDTVQVDYFQNQGLRYLIDFGYNGTLFQGTQRQNPPIRTVQNELENVLSHIFQTPIEISPASRTDRGVHAFHNYAHFDAPPHLETKELKSIIERMIPEDIKINDVSKVSTIFHARYDASSKCYQYRFRFDLDVNHMHSAWHVPSVNIDEIKEKMKLFIGVHDFKNFSKYRDFPSTIRYIESLRLWEDNGTWIFEFIGPSFLRYMIRMMVGALIKHDIETIKKGLEEPDISMGKHLAPSHGLYLMNIEY